MAPNTDQYGLNKRNEKNICLDVIDEFIVCISGMVRTQQRIDDFLFLKEHLIKGLSCGCSNEADLIGFGELRTAQIDREQAAKKRYVSYIPLSFECSNKIRCQNLQPVSAEADVDEI